VCYSLAGRLCLLEVLDVVEVLEVLEAMRFVRLCMLHANLYAGGAGSCGIGCAEGYGGRAEGV